MGGSDDTDSTTTTTTTTRRMAAPPQQAAEAARARVIGAAGTGLIARDRLHGATSGEGEGFRGACWLCGKTRHAASECSMAHRGKGTDCECDGTHWGSTATTVRTTSISGESAALGGGMACGRRGQGTRSPLGNDAGRTTNPSRRWLPSTKGASNKHHEVVPRCMNRDSNHTVLDGEEEELHREQADRPADNVPLRADWYILCLLVLADSGRLIPESTRPQSQQRCRKCETRRVVKEREVARESLAESGKLRKMNWSQGWGTEVNHVSRKRRARTTCTALRDCWAQRHTRRERDWW